MKEFILDDERMYAFINIIAESTAKNPKISSTAKKQLIRVYGLFAQIFDHAIIPFLPRLFQKMIKHVQEDQEEYAMTFGTIAFHLLHERESEEREDTTDLAISLYDYVYTKIHQNNRTISMGGSLWMAKLIQNTPNPILIKLCQNIVTETIEALNLSNFKGHHAVIEGLTSLILSIEKDFVPYAQQVLPVLIRIS